MLQNLSLPVFRENVWVVESDSLLRQIMRLPDSGANIKLSELELGIGPFVVGPAVERKIGLSAFSQLTIDAASWRTAEWAKTRGLLFRSACEHAGTRRIPAKTCNHLSRSSPEAMKEIKKMFWHDTDHWDQLLAERAKISGHLVVSPLSAKSDCDV